MDSSSSISVSSEIVVSSHSTLEEDILSANSSSSSSEYIETIEVPRTIGSVAIQDYTVAETYLFFIAFVLIAFSILAIFKR